MLALLRRVRSGKSAEAGATAAEYAIMAGLIAVVIIVAVTFFGIRVNSLFTYTGTKIAEVIK